MRTRIDSQAEAIVAALGYWLAIGTSILMVPASVAGRGKTWGLVLLMVFLLPATFFAFLGVALIQDELFPGMTRDVLFAPLAIEAGGFYLWIRKRRGDGALSR